MSGWLIVVLVVWAALVGGLLGYLSGMSVWLIVVLVVWAALVGGSLGYLIGCEHGQAATEARAAADDDPEGLG